jgi:ribosomal-protein-alanine N-acetyltransferase
MKIIGNKIYLENFNESHLHNPSYLVWLRDIDVMKYVGREEYLKPISFEEVKEYVKNVLKDKYSIFFAVHDKESGEFIGTTKVNFINEMGIKTQTADIGIMIGNKAFWGKGLAKDILYTISEYCFNDLNLRKLTAGAFKQNVAVIKAFTKIGYLEEACIREKILINNEYFDQVLLGCFRNELKKN